jgi:hypothetical protein
MSLSVINEKYTSEKGNVLQATPVASIEYGASARVDVSLTSLVSA